MYMYNISRKLHVTTIMSPFYAQASMYIVRNCPMPGCSELGTHSSLSGCPNAGNGTLSTSSASYIQGYIPTVSKCPTPGCNGLGNVNLRRKTHRSAWGCPLQFFGEHTSGAHPLSTSPALWGIPTTPIVYSQMSKCPTPGYNGLGNVNPCYKTHLSSSGYPLVLFGELTSGAQPLSTPPALCGISTTPIVYSQMSNCPTPGCDGLGNVNLHYKTHHSSSGCPRLLFDKLISDAQPLSTPPALRENLTTPNLYILLLAQSKATMSDFTPQYVTSYEIVIIQTYFCY